MYVPWKTSFSRNTLDSIAVSRTATASLSRSGGAQDDHRDGILRDQHVPLIDASLRCRRDRRAVDLDLNLLPEPAVEELRGGSGVGRRHVLHGNRRESARGNRDGG